MEEILINIGIAVCGLLLLTLWVNFMIMSDIAYLKGYLTNSKTE